MGGIYSRICPKPIRLACEYRCLGGILCAVKLLIVQVILSLIRNRYLGRSRLAIGSLLDAIRTAWAGPTQPARKPVKFVAFLSQIPPSGPSLPVVPVYNNCTVNNLRFRSQHGMEEVIGSIPIRSTIESTTYRISPLWVRSICQQIQRPLTEAGADSSSFLPFFRFATVPFCALISAAAPPLAGRSPARILSRDERPFTARTEEPEFVLNSR